MDRDKIAREMVDFFNHAYIDLMPTDKKEKLRIETMIQDKVHSELENDTDEQSIINDIIKQLQKRKNDGQSWLELKLKQLSDNK